MSERLIAYLELTGLPAAAEQQARPRHRRSALAVTTEAGRRLLSVSAQARSAGLRPGMSTWEARYRCPGLVCVPEDPAKYRAFFATALELLGELTPLVEAVGETAAFADLSGTGLLWGAPQGACRRLLGDLERQLGLPARVGLGPNKLAARLACGLAERGQVRELGFGGTLAACPGPAGQRAGVPLPLAAELAPLPLRALPGLSPTLRSRLGLLGLRTLGDLAAMPDDLLGQAFGPEGRLLAKLARGEDEAPVHPGALPPAARLVELLPLEPGTDDPARLRAAALTLVQRLGGRLRALDRVAGNLHLVLGFRNYRDLVLTTALPAPTCLDQELFRAADRLLDRLRLDGRQVCLMRLVALGLRAAPADGQLVLPGLERTSPARARRLDLTLDRIRRRYGETAVGRAGARASAPAGPDLAPPPAAAQPRHGAGHPLGRPLHGRPPRPNRLQELVRAEGKEKTALP